MIWPQHPLYNGERPLQQRLRLAITRALTQMVTCIIEQEGGLWAADRLLLDPGGTEQGVGEPALTGRPLLHIIHLWTGGGNGQDCALFPLALVLSWEGIAQDRLH